MEQWDLSYRHIKSRNIGLLYEAQQELIRQAEVAVAGTGGVGGIAAELFVRIGFGGVRLADPEVFEPTNLQRQLGSTVETLGRNKAESLAERLSIVDPHVRVVVYDKGIDEGNIAAFLDGADVIMDAIDYAAPKARLLLYDHAHTNVISPPAGGFGTLLMNYAPGTYEFRKLFDEEGSQFRTEKILAGAQHLPQYFFERVARGHISTYPPAVFLSGVLTVNEAVKTVLYNAWRRGDLADEYRAEQHVPTLLPFATRVDLAAMSMETINLDG